VPDDGTCELNHVEQCYMTLRSCVGWSITFVCDLEKHNAMYQNKIIRGSQACSSNKHKNLKHSLNLERFY